MMLKNWLRGLLCTAGLCAAAATADAQVVISAVYPGGGGSATYQFDYIELFNKGTTQQSLSGLSLQYGSSTGQFASTGSNLYLLPAVTLNPGQYYLVQTSTAGASTGMPSTTPDVITTNLSMSGASGKVALANTTTALGCGATATPCALPHGMIVDLVSWGASNNAEGGVTVNNGVAIAATDALTRNDNGCTDSNNNNNDFTKVSAASIVFRNSMSAAAPCSGSSMGACCTGFTCNITTQALCGGTFNGAASCTPNVCDPTGACCNGTSCSIVAQSACGGTFNGAASCTPNPCDTTGACCFGSLCDIAASAAECTLFGGSNFQQGVACTPNPCAAPTEEVVISQIYGGGGNAGATYNHDFVEIFNRGSTPVNISNWSIQYAAAAGTSWSVATIGATPFTLDPGRYYLVQLGTNNSDNGAVLVPDHVGPGTNMGSNAGKVALVKGTTALTGGNPSTGPTVVDFVGYGSTATGSEGTNPVVSILTGTAGNTQSMLRKGNGCVDTNNNGNDFVANGVLPTPRSLATAANNCGSATTGACCVSGSCSLTSSGGCSGVFNGLGSTCMPDPCIVAQGSCCVGTNCTTVAQASCSGTWTSGGVCTPSPCSGACCNGVSCTITDAAGCVAPGYYRVGLTCSPSDCPVPVAVQAGDIALGINLAGNSETLMQVRGAGSPTPSLVGNWTRFGFVQSVEFDNAGGVAHSASGNLLALNFGSFADGGFLYNISTNGSNAGQQVFAFKDTDPGNTFGVPTTRVAGVSVSPNNSKIAVAGTDVGRVIVFDYSAGATVGTGAGASLTAAAMTPALPTGTPTAADFMTQTGTTPGTVWLNDTTVLFWGVNSNADYNPGSGVVPLASGRPALFTIDASGPTLGAPIARVQPSAAQDVDASSRFCGLAYNPAVSPYVYAISSSFTSSGNVSKTKVYVINPTGWALEKVIDLSGSENTPAGSTNSGREIAVGPDRKLYIACFFGSSGVPAPTAATEIIETLNLDTDNSGSVTAADIAGMTDFSAVGFFQRGTTTNSSFTGMDVAFGAAPATQNCCRGTTCKPVASGTCTGTVAGSFSVTVTTCTGNTFAGCCFGDYDHNGTKDITDIFTFLNAWFSASSYADITGNGASTPDITDIFTFLNAWFGAC